MWTSFQDQLSKLVSFHRERLYQQRNAVARLGQGLRVLQGQTPLSFCYASLPRAATESHIFHIPFPHIAIAMHTGPRLAKGSGTLLAR